MEKIMRNVFREMERCRVEVDTFSERLAEDPAHAFSWGSDAVMCAGTMEVLERYYDWMVDVTKGVGEESLVMVSIRESAMREVIRGARSPSRSTSPMHNLTDEGRLAGHAKMLEMLDFS